MGTCPVCGSETIMIEGCEKCKNPDCIWAKCD